MFGSEAPNKAAPARFARLEGDNAVKRVLKKKAPFFKAENYKQPTWRGFLLTQDDVDEGVRRDRVPGLSVFSVDRTTSGQAVSIRRHFAQLGGRELGDVLIFQIAVDEIRRIGREHEKTVDVVTDPLFDEETGAPLPLAGADGHCVVEGLYDEAAWSRISRGKKPPKEYRAVLDALAGTAVNVPLDEASHSGK